MASKIAQYSPTWLQLAHNMRPRGSNTAPRRLQVAKEPPKEAPERPTSFKHLGKPMLFAFSPFRFRWALEASRWLQDGPKTAPRASKSAPRGPQEGPKRAPRQPQERPRALQEASWALIWAPLGPPWAHPGHPLARGPIYPICLLHYLGAPGDARLRCCFGFALPLAPARSRLDSARSSTSS